MNIKSTFPKKKTHWIDRLIIFVAFMGGFLLSTTVYSNDPIKKEIYTAQKSDEEAPRLVLEENLVRIDQEASTEVLQDSIRQRGASYDEKPLDPIDDHVLWGLDFSPNSQAITIKIHLEENQRNSELPLEISFIPDEQCEFGDGRACIYPLSDRYGNPIILASIHSGVGREAEAFRNFIEGTGFNQAHYPLAQVIKNVQSLEDSTIQILQEGQVLTGLELISILRVPPEHLDAYMALPVEQILDFAIDITDADPETFNQSLLIFETCGWQLPDEDPIEGHTVTSSSVYLGIIGLTSP